MAFGPRHDLMISATVFAAVMFDSWALRPNCRSPPGVCVSVVVLVGCRVSRANASHTHNNHWRLHFEGMILEALYRRKRGSRISRGGVSCLLVPCSSYATFCYQKPTAS